MHSLPRRPFLVLALTGGALHAADAKKTELWNGKDLAGWSGFLADNSVDLQSTGSIAGGALHLDAKKANGYIRTGKSFANYRLHLEWRWLKEEAANSNSGILLHMGDPDAIWPAAFECQLRTGNPATPGRLSAWAATSPTHPCRTTARARRSSSARSGSSRSERGLRERAPVPAPGSRRADQCVSIFNPRISRKCFSLRVTSTPPFTRAVAAIQRSFSPVITPRFCRSRKISAARHATASLNG